MWAEECLQLARDRAYRGGKLQGSDVEKDENAPVLPAGYLTDAQGRGRAAGNPRRLPSCDVALGGRKMKAHRRRGRVRRKLVRSYRDLHYAVTAVPKEFVGLNNVIELIAVCDQRRRIKSFAANKVH